jgi:multicomponent Na+:H+ antiporter subunit G
MSSSLGHIGSISLPLHVTGLFLWFWGSWPLLENRPLLVRLHKLTVADALGSMLILLGLLIQRPQWWPLFGLAMLGVLLWSTIFGYVVAAGSHKRPEV